MRCQTAAPTVATRAFFFGFIRFYSVFTICPFFTETWERQEYIFGAKNNPHKSHSTKVGGSILLLFIKHDTCTALLARHSNRFLLWLTQIAKCYCPRLKAEGTFVARTCSLSIIYGAKFANRSRLHQSRTWSHLYDAF